MGRVIPSLLELPCLFTVAPPLPDDPNDLSESADSGREEDIAPTQKKMGGVGGKYHVINCSAQESHMCREKMLRLQRIELEP